MISSVLKGATLFGRKTLLGGSVEDVVADPIVQTTKPSRWINPSKSLTHINASKPSSFQSHWAGSIHPSRRDDSTRPSHWAESIHQNRGVEWIRPSRRAGSIYPSQRVGTIQGWVPGLSVFWLNVQSSVFTSTCSVIFYY